MNILNIFHLYLYSQLEPSNKKIHNILICGDIQSWLQVADVNLLHR